MPAKRAPKVNSSTTSFSIPPLQLMPQPVSVFNNIEICENNQGIQNDNIEANVDVNIEANIEANIETNNSEEHNGGRCQVCDRIKNITPCSCEETVSAKCNECQATKPAKDFYIRSARKNGLSAICKDCTAKIKADKAEKGTGESMDNLGSRSEPVPMPEVVVCIRCKISKPRSDFKYDSKRATKCAARCKQCTEESKNEKEETPREHRTAGSCKICKKPNAKAICTGHAEVGNVGSRCTEEHAEEIKIPGYVFCPSCQKQLPMQDFTKRIERSNGLCRRCKQCVKNHIL